MARFLWVLVIGAALLVTSSAFAQRGPGGKGKGKNRDRSYDQGGDQQQDFGRSRFGDQGGDQQKGFGRGRFGEQGDPSGSGNSRRGGQEGRTMTMMGGGGDQIFDSLSGGKGILNRNDLDPGRQRFFDTVAKAGNVSGDTMSRQQFSTAFDQMRANVGSGGGPMMFNIRSEGGGRGGPFGGDRASRADDMFNRLDA